jgi:predicted transcriptional regulator
MKQHIFLSLPELTEMEHNVLGTLIECLYAEEGFSDVAAEDLAQETGIPTRQIRGVISSLVKKGIVLVDDGYGSAPIINLRREHYDLHPRWGKE